MLGALGIIDADFSCPCVETIATRRIGREPTLAWIARRVTECLRLDGVVVVTGGDSADRIAGSLVPSYIPVVGGPVEDRLGRLAEAVARHRAEAAVIVPADAPLIDPVLVDRLVTAATTGPLCDHLMYCSRDGEPAGPSPVGTHVEWIRTKALLDIEQRTARPTDRRDPIGYLRARPQRYVTRTIDVPEGLEGAEAHLCEGGSVDWERVLAIYESIGQDDLDWQRVADALKGFRHRAEIPRPHAETLARQRTSISS